MRKKLEVIYIAGPYSGEDAAAIQRHVDVAQAAGQEILRRGHACLCPHSMTHDWDIGTGIEYETFLHTDLELLARCDAVLMLPGWSRSRGAMGEYQEARRLGLKIYLGLEEIREVRR